MAFYTFPCLSVPWVFFNYEITLIFLNFHLFYHICKAKLSFQSPWGSFCSDLVCCNMENKSLNCYRGYVCTSWVEKWGRYSAAHNESCCSIQLNYLPPLDSKRLQNGHVNDHFMGFQCRTDLPLKYWRWTTRHKMAPRDIWLAHWLPQAASAIMSRFKLYLE